MQRVTFWRSLFLKAILWGFVNVLASGLQKKRLYQRA